MFSSSLLVALFAGVATSLPNDISARTLGGNPFNAFCTLDECLVKVVASGLPIPSKALDDCSAFLQKTVTLSAAATVTSFVTPSQGAVTVTVTRTLPASGTTLQVTSTFVDNAGETDTVTSTVEETSTALSTDRVTTTQVDVATVTVTATSTALQATVTAPGKRQVGRDQPRAKGRCRHQQSSSSSLSTSSTTSSGDVPLPSGCVDEAQYSSACSCAYATAITVTEPAPTAAVTVFVTQDAVEQVTVTATATVSNGEVLTETDVLSTTQTSTSTEFVTATTTETNVVGATTTETDGATLASTATVTTTAVVAAPAGPSCPPVPSSCPPPTFYLQIADGTGAGQYLTDQGQLNPIIPSFLFGMDDKTMASKFTIDSAGVLVELASPFIAGGPVYFQTNGFGTDSEAFLGTFEDQGFIDPSYQKLHVRAEADPSSGSGSDPVCGPGCPVPSGSLVLDAPGLNMGYNTLLYCNGFIEITVNGRTTCTRGVNVSNRESLIIVPA
ncbi:hypothetical protein PG993_010956 [Apiospora rasikravindrae]|uniref:Uncharacterized protein n=1 Tax=Apiospora rasikravindrae TaxID=990691 RepID=A0ABR1SCW9_9PEZI